MKVAVTGATGFIGRHVLAELADVGAEVVPVSRTSTNLQGVIQMDIGTPPANPYGALGYPDVMIHLAWSGLPNYRSPHHVETELPQQFSFLSALVDGGLPSLLVTGTCFEYGMKNGMLSEDMETRPENPYGCAKDLLRQKLQLLQRHKSFALTWARLFYTFGEGQPANSLYPQLKAALKRGDPTFQMSAGQQVRDYLPVRQIARYIVALALSGKDIQVVNIASGQPISVLELVQKWLSENNQTIALDLGYYPYPDYEPMAFWGANKRLHAALGEGPLRADPGSLDSD